jgi:hypothetical protein
MAFQGISTPRGEVTQLSEIEGSKLVGTKVKAPFAVYPEVWVLPMENVLATKVRRDTGSLDESLLTGSGRALALLPLSLQTHPTTIRP